jgi:hypothetical protein
MLDFAAICIFIKNNAHQIYDETALIDVRWSSNKAEVHLDLVSKTEN